MIYEFLSAVSEELKAFAAQLDSFSIGANIRFEEEVEEKSIVIFGVKESRGSGIDFNSDIDFDAVRKEFYKLKKGNWHLPIYDLGDLEAGANIEDTYFALLKIQEELLKKKCIIIPLGGTADLAYIQYRAFDVVSHKVNLACVDNRFRLGDDSLELSVDNYLSKIISQEPHQLFEYSHLGYQTYFVGQEELDLMEELNFDVKRLGVLTESISESEPELRNSDMVVLNVESIQSSDFKSSINTSPNGFSAREICSLSRYAGINNKVQSFGVYNYKAKNILVDEILLAEVLWYFIEGKNHSVVSLSFEENENFETYYVQLPDRDLIFYLDVNAQQWWLELNEIKDLESLGRQAVPCSSRDYENSLKGKFPDRWWKSYKKLF